MNKPNTPPAVDGNFSTFMLGLTIGVVGSLLLGTEEGRKITKKLLDSMANGLEKNEDLFQDAKVLVQDAYHELETKITTPTYLPDQTPHTPPPATPYIHRSSNPPAYFHSGSGDLK